MSYYIQYLKEENLMDNMSKDAIYNYIQGGYQGSCDTLSEDDQEWLIDNNLLETFDNDIFCCPCGWWCDSSEQNELEGETVCDDCFSE